jgi:RecG-like helicase
MINIDSKEKNWLLEFEHSKAQMKTLDETKNTWRTLATLLRNETSMQTTKTKNNDSQKSDSQNSKSSKLISNLVFSLTTHQQGHKQLSNLHNSSLVNQSETFKRFTFNTFHRFRELRHPASRHTSQSINMRNCAN